MSNPPPIPEGPPMGDEDADLTRRLSDLEEIAERLAATCVDPVAVDDFLSWKAAGS